MEWDDLESFPCPANSPKTLKPGNFVAVCIHFPKWKGTAIWGPGGLARNPDGMGTHFHASVMCPKCIRDRRFAEFKRAKFYDGMLNFGWWEFQANPNPGRPRKRKENDKG